MTESAQTPRAPRRLELDHITLPVADLQLAEAFYVDLLGARLVSRFDRETFLRLRPGRAAEADAANSPLHLTIKFGDGPDIQLFLQRDHMRERTAPHPHLAVRVDADELDSVVLRLLGAGVPCDGPRRLGGPGHASIYFADPWGQLLEFAASGYLGATQSGPPDVAKLAYAWPSGVRLSP